VQGVNDASLVEASADADNSVATSGPISSYPLSAAALADQQSRAARYGGLDGAAKLSGGNLVASVETPTATLLAGGRPRAFDASEGTPLDPLLNTTYDLNYPKVVPTLK